MQDKRDKLNQLKLHLKKEFVGLDISIDKVIESITPWYLYQETFEYPFIVGIWGPTGTGKTKVVKKICEFLDIHYNYIDSKNLKLDHYGNIPSNNNYSFNFFQDVQIFDEFHNLFTKNPNETVNQEHKFNSAPIFRFMSEGEICLNRRDFFAEFYVNFMNKIARDSYSFSKTSKESKNEKFTQIFTETLNKIKIKFNLPDFETDNLKDLIKNNEFEKIILGFHNFSNTLVTEDRMFSRKSNQLVFVLGNLDDLFENIDFQYNDTGSNKEKILFKTHQDVLDSLSKLFFPEEVSRLGTNHIIFPVLTQEEYKEIINRKLTKTKEIFKQQNINLEFSEKLKKVIYNKIVHPKYGARTLDSSYRSLFEAPLLTKIDQIDKNGLVDIKENTLFIKTSNKEILIPLISSKKKDVPEEVLNQIAIHEAGHTLVHFLLTKELPEFVTANIDSGFFGGITKFKENKGLKSKEDLKKTIQVLLGGILAEKLILGEDKVSSGSYSDLKKATLIAENMVTKFGLGKNLSHVEINSNFINKSLYSMSQEIDKEIKEIIDNCQIKVDGLLSENKDLLQKVSEKIKSKDRITGDELKDVLVLK